MTLTVKGSGSGLMGHSGHTLTGMEGNQQEKAKIFFI